jgi:hypothetical protein
MSASSHDRLIGGWLRLLLGIAQQILALAAMVALLTAGLVPMTWVLVGMATAFTIISRWLYRHRTEQKIEKE